MHTHTCTYTYTVKLSQNIQTQNYRFCFTAYTQYVYYSHNFAPKQQNSLIPLYILCTFTVFLHFWFDAKLHFVVSVLVLCAMKIKLNLIYKKNHTPDIK